ncbi:flagellar filament capping protein FliD, partial [Rhodoferax sp. UBA5149]|uniref:flagellar filament capping protein FliD n=1 Tax=Rhodoferax sp. UBA5149 TaxID=1947379 RepID=UPI0025ED52FF
MAITSSSTTALDVPTLVSQLMAVERRPIDKLTTKIASYETKISSFGTLSSLVSSFQTAAKGLNTGLQKLAATPSDPGVLSATTGSSAVPGSYAVNVSQLAQSHSLVASGQASSTAAIGDGSATTVTFDLGAISGGTLTNGIYSGAAFTSNGSGTVSLSIDGSNNTLEGIRDAINAAAPGVTATIVNDGSGTPYRLALSSSSSGVSNSVKITTSGGDGAIDSLLGYDPAGTQNLTQTLAAQDAKLTVNGIAITSASNTVNEAIQGVTLTLKNTTATPAS